MKPINVFFLFILTGFLAACGNGEDGDDVQGKFELSATQVCEGSDITITWAGGRSTTQVIGPDGFVIASGPAGVYRLRAQAGIYRLKNGPAGVGASISVALHSGEWPAFVPFTSSTCGTIPFGAFEGLRGFRSAAVIAGFEPKIQVTTIGMPGRDAMDLYRVPLAGGAADLHHTLVTENTTPPPFSFNGIYTGYSPLHNDETCSYRPDLGLTVTLSCNL
jgi:hypothetical protein